MSILENELHLSSGKVIKNRICKAAMTERIASADNYCNERHIRLYEKWASGNIGLLLTGNVQIDRQHMEGPANICIEESTYLSLIHI